MRERGQGFVRASAVAACAVCAGGLLVAGPGGWAAVAFGAAVGFAVQAGAFWLLAVNLFPAQPLLVYGLGMAGRMLAAAAVAFLAVPGLGLPAAPVLFSLVSVFFVTALLEPVYLFPASSSKS
ncbi:MAG TPA: hypothetical protein VHG51_02005 [Longimicrobiaceae bacterium]|nr:hypothetical protein [Longimicrobiaceae bacterium]